MSVLKTFADRLQEERKRLGVNQGTFSSLAGVSRTAQSNYELGLRSPDVAYLQEIEKQGADIFYLLTGNRSGDSGAIDLKEEVFLSFDAYEVVSQRLKKYDVSLEKKKEAAWLLYQIYKESEEPDERMVDSVISLLEG